ncbi:hypothetical protein [Pseudomonas guariconensis]|uniref:hypothetical protein n=1 Tax=Pseudomonas guariconensis TaxID=1288410 RepID=UPI001E29BF1C|nr:hypothetical protein [Pseudomonas guariconensis]
MSELQDNVRYLKKEFEAQPAPNHVKLRDGGGGGGSDLEARIAKLETHVEYIRRDLDVIVDDLREHRKETRSDFRILFGALITATLGLAALMAKGFGWL